MAARKDFDPSRHGLTMEEWQALTPQERKRSSARAKYRSRRQKNPDELRAKWRRKRDRHIEKMRERDLARYWADPEKRRKQSRDSYWRHHEKQLARCQARWAKHGSISSIRHDPDEVYRRVMAAIPRGLPRFVRDDVAGMICLAVLEGKLLVKNIEKEITSYLRSYNREYDTFKTVSLDAPAPGAEGMTLLDTLSADLDA